MTYTAKQLMECALRETRKRRRLYPNRVETGRMTRYEARREIAMMQAIAEHFAQQEIKERLL